MQDTPVGLNQLYQSTRTLLESSSLTRAIDWIDGAAPNFVSACRNTIQSEPVEVIDCWLEWLRGLQVRVLEEAGKGEVFAWRCQWLLRFLMVARELKTVEPTSQSRAVLARRLVNEHAACPACFPPAFWYDLVDYLALPETGLTDAVGGSSLPKYAVTFPLVLSEAVFDGGSDTNVVLAEWVLEPTSRATSGVLMDPSHVCCRGGADGSRFAWYVAAERSRVLRAHQCG